MNQTKMPSKSEPENLTMRCFIYDILPAGKRNAISRKELVARSGLSDRQLRHQIAAERRAGAVIISTTENGGGYYRPENPEEIRRFVASMVHRGKEIFAAVKSARVALADMEGGEDEQQ